MSTELTPEVPKLEEGKYYRFLFSGQSPAALFMHKDQSLQGPRNYTLTEESYYHRIRGEVARQGYDFFQGEFPLQLQGVQRDRDFVEITKEQFECLKHLWNRV